MAFTEQGKSTETFDTQEKPKHGSVAQFGVAKFGKARFGRTDVSWDEQPKTAESFTSVPKPV